MQARRSFPIVLLRLRSPRSARGSRAHSTLAVLAVGLTTSCAHEQPEYGDPLGGLPEVERAHTTVLEVGDYQIDLRSNVAAHVAVIDKGSPGNPGPATPVLVCDSVSLDEGFGFDDCAGEATHGGEYRVEVSADAASLSYDLTVTQFGSVKGSWPNQTIEAPASQPAGN